MNSKKNKLLFTALKIFIVWLTISWLIEQGKLTTESFDFIFSNTKSYVIVIFLIACVSIPLVCIRWAIILKDMGLKKRDFFYIYKVTLISLFFSLFIPGSATADLTKGYYLHKNDINKTNIYFSILLDRVIGLYSIVLIIFIFYVINYDVISRHNILNLFCNALFVGFFLSNLIAIIFKNKILNNIKNYKIKFTGYKLSKIVGCILLIKKETFIKALVLSMLNQLSVAITCFIVGTTISNIGLNDFANVAFITPIGEISTMIPLFPIGIGLGHVSYEELYLLFNYENGTNIFNILMSARIIVGIIGGVTYITSNRKA